MKFWCVGEIRFSGPATFISSKWHWLYLWYTMRNLGLTDDSPKWLPLWRPLQIKWVIMTVTRTENNVSFLDAAHSPTSIAGRPCGVSECYVGQAAFAEAVLLSDWYTVDHTFSRCCIESETKRSLKSSIFSMRHWSEAQGQGYFWGRSNVSWL